MIMKLFVLFLFLMNGFSTYKIVSFWMKRSLETVLCELRPLLKYYVSLGWDCDTGDLEKIVKRNVHTRSKQTNRWQRQERTCQHLHSVMKQIFSSIFMIILCRQKFNLISNYDDALAFKVWGWRGCNSWLSTDPECSVLLWLMLVWSVIIVITWSGVLHLSTDHCTGSDTTMR